MLASLDVSSILCPRIKSEIKSSYNSTDCLIHSILYYTGMVSCITCQSVRFQTVYKEILLSILRLMWCTKYLNIFSFFLVCSIPMPNLTFVCDQANPVKFLLSKCFLAAKIWVKRTLEIGLEHIWLIWAKEYGLPGNWEEELRKYCLILQTTWIGLRVWQ